MFGTALRDGLRGWARAPIRAGLGTAVTLCLLIVTYALVIEISLDFWLTLVLWSLVANLALGGWVRFCAGLIGGGGGLWNTLFAGFRRPITATCSGTVAAGLVLLPTLLVGSVIAFAHGPEWLVRLGVVASACLTAPAGLFIIFEAMTGAGAPHAITDGIKRARTHWPALIALALLTFGLAAAGSLPGLLLERHALTQISALLPTVFAEYGLAIVRLVALVGGVASVSATGCIWAAAWRAAGEKPSPPL